MFLDEARLVARIRHPNVVPTLDVTITDGELFLVMDYVQGESLSRLIRGPGPRNGNMSANVAATIIAGVLHGLQAAHEARGEHNEPLGIVHRDVSPQNVLVGVDGVPRVLDFGIAKAVGRLHSTRDGQMKGKVAYMAPEQMEGVATPASDVYAASVVLWEALTGRRLFAGENEVAIMRQVLAGEVEPPSEFAPGIPAALSALTLRGLSLKPQDRFSSAGEMALAVEDAVPLVPASRIGSWVRSAAEEVLGVRSRRIALIERDSSTSVPELPATEPLPRSALSRPDSAAVVDPPAKVDTKITQIATGISAPGRGPARAPAWNRRVIAGAGVAGGAFAILLVGSALSARRATPERRAVGHAADPIGFSQAPDAQPSATSVRSETAAPASTFAAHPEPAAPAVALSSLPVVVTAPPATHPRPMTRDTGHARKPGPSPASACTPPYFFDAEGNRVFKKECL